MPSQMQSTQLSRRLLITVMIALLLLFFIEESAFQRLRQAGWNTYYPNEGFSTIAVDPNGQLWAFPESGDFLTFDGQAWTKYPLTNFPLEYFKRVSAIAFDHNGQAWVGTNAGEVGVLKGHVWSSNTPNQSGFKDGLVDAIMEDQQQHIWVGTHDGNGHNQGVEVFDGTSWNTGVKPGADALDEGVVDMQMDSQGRVWMAVSGGDYSDCEAGIQSGGGGHASLVSMYDGKHWTDYSWGQMGMKGPYSIQAIAVDKQDNIWVGTNGGLHVFDGKQWQTVFDETQAVATNGASGDYCIEDIAVDPQGKVWIIMGQGRLGIFDGQKWIRLDRQTLTLPSDSNVLAIAPDGRVWIASGYQGGLWSTSSAQPPLVPAALVTTSYMFALALRAGLWVLFGLAVLVGKNKIYLADVIAAGEALPTKMQSLARHVICGAVIGSAFPLVVYPFLLGIGIMLSGDAYGTENINVWPTYGWFSGPLAGALAGFIFGSMARLLRDSMSPVRVGAVIGAITGAWYGIIQMVAFTYPEFAPRYFTFGYSALEALIGMFLGMFAGVLFLRKVSAPTSA